MIRRNRSKRLNESSFDDVRILGLNEIKEFCNEIKESFEESGVPCNVVWYAIGYCDIFSYDSEFNPIKLGSVFIQFDVYSYVSKGNIILRDDLKDETSIISSFKQGVLCHGSQVFEAFDPVEVEEAIGAR